MKTLAEKNMMAPQVLDKIRKIYQEWVARKISSDNALSQIDIIMTVWEMSDYREE